MPKRRVAVVAAAAVVLALLPSCGGDPTKPTPVPSALVVVSGNNQSDTVAKALPNPFVVKVVDAHGTGVADVSVAWAVTVGGGTLSATHTTTNQTGHTSVTLTLGASPGTNTVSATVTPLPAVVFTATANPPPPPPPPPAQLGFTVQPSSATAGAAIAPSVKVTLLDAQGHPTTATNDVTVAITPGTGGTGASLGGTATQSAVNGVATFTNLAICKAATGYSLTATASGLAADTSSAFNIAPGPGALLQFTVPPSDITAGAIMSPAVEVSITDGCGNLATTATDTVTIALGACCAGPGATLSGTLGRTPVSGVVTFNDLTIDKADSDYTLTVSATRVAGNSSSFFAVHVGPPARVGFIVPPTNRVADAKFDYPLVVQVEDAQRNQVRGVAATVTLTITPGTGAPGATLSGTLSRPISGTYDYATFDDVSIDTPGAGYTLTAAAAGLHSDTSVAFGVFAPLVATAVSASPYLTTCALKSGGTPYCWGDNVSGEIGDGTTTNRSAPVAVAGGLTLSALSAGTNHSCGLTSGGAAYCWGTNSSGELGNGSFTPANTPVAVSGGHAFTSLSAGAYHNCALTADSAAYCWGSNNGGALGTGSGSPPSSTPVPVSGGHDFSMVHAGTSRTCGVTTANEAYCWGSAVTLVSGGLTFAMVGTGTFHSCGLTTGGAAYCWGENNHGQLGDGTTNTSATPVPVSGGLTFTALSVGYYQNCGLTAGGTIYCWGDNGSGQLGDGTTTERHAPTPVSGGLTFTSVSTGYVHTCGIATGGVVWCWGNNYLGTLGDRSVVESHVPVRVSEP